MPVVSMPVTCIPTVMRHDSVSALHPIYYLMRIKTLTIILVTAMTVNCVTAFVAILSATALRFILVRLNKKLDRGEGLGDGGGVPGQASSRGFRFLV